MLRFSIRSVLCIFIGLLAGQAFAQASVKLEYKFNPGEVNCYRVKEKAVGDKKIGPIKLDSDWDGILRLNVIKVLPNGDVEINASYKSGTMKMQGQIHKIKPDEVPPVKIKVSKNGTILNLEEINQSGVGVVRITVDTSDGGSHTAGANVYTSVLRSLWQEFPPKALGQGAKWKQNVLSPSLVGTVTARCELQKTNDKFNKYKVVSIIRNIDEKSPALTNNDGKDELGESAAGSVK